MCKNAKPIFNQDILGEGQKDSRWNTFIEQIENNNVIPVIGPDFLIQMSDGDFGNPHQVIINELAKNMGIRVEYDSFSKLLYDEKFPKKHLKAIYTVLAKAYGRFGFEPSKLLMDLLGTRRFPFVITTSFTTVVEDAMKKIWGKDVRTMVFSNNPKENNDVSKAEDIYQPTVYYMFGRIAEKEHSYVIDDTDMLSFCRSWLDEGKRPAMLSKILQGKYLFVLGNDYSDWLCRFVWFSMKPNIKNEQENNGMIVFPHEESNLLNFMERIDVFTHTNPQEAIGKMLNKLKERESNRSDENKFDKCQRGEDVFISYSRRDEKLAQKLYEALTEKGINAWYDRKNLGIGDDFMAEIKRSIQSAKLFVPILTDTITNEKNESHPYRIEWDTAINTAKGFGRSFIYPIYSKGFDFYEANIPDDLQKHNAFELNEEQSNFGSFAEEIKKALTKLSNRN